MALWLTTFERGRSLLLRQKATWRVTYPVVPDRNRVRLPVEARLEVGVLGELMEEELEDGVRLRLRDADDAAGEA